jgi:hypothetical protein
MSDQRTGIWERGFTIFSALEKMLVVIGVPIAAYWTYYTFISNDSQQARLNYETELARARSFGVQIDIDAETLRKARQRYVSGKVVVKNIGAQFIAIDRFAPDLVTVGRVSEGSRGSSRTNPVVFAALPENRNARRFVAISPQRSITLPFVARVPGPGWYLVQFTGSARFLHGRTATEPRTWSNKAMVRVE